MNKKDTTKIGLLFVHGIGEQRRFEHLEEEARQIIRCLKHQHPNAHISVTTNTSQDSAYQADQITWRADDDAPIRIDIATRSGQTDYVIELRETWWADLDERKSLPSQVKFWLWGLTQWLNQSKVPPCDDLLNKTRGKQPTAKHRSIARVKLFFISVFFSMVLVTLSLANFIIHKLLKGKIPGSYVISSYLGDVKLMTQDGYEGKSTLSNIGLPPRVAVRRRTIRSYIDMAMSGYDRWYVLAHSLGTVVALNGLMETELCLPNYLTESDWDRCKNFQVGIDDENNSVYLGRDKESANASGKEMFPPRPPWLSDKAVISREHLFGKLDGFLTYGSPLDKFYTLWPHIVGINDNEAPFNNQFQWINVFDETDPVAGKLDYYGLPDETPQNQNDANLFIPGPENYAFSANPILLYSHLCYLKYKPEQSNRLVNHLCSWIINGGSFEVSSPNDKLWNKLEPRRPRSLFKYVQWFVASVVLATASGWVVNSILSLSGLGLETIIASFKRDPAPDQSLINFGILGLGTALTVTLVFGLLKLIRDGKTTE